MTAVSPLRAIVRVLTALHKVLGRWLAQPVQPTKAKAKRGSHLPSSRGTRDGAASKPLVRRKAKRADRGNQDPADSDRTSERKGVCWFDLKPGTLALPRDPDEEEAAAWERAHFRINGQRLP
jgi:hypothetical protein